MNTSPRTESRGFLAIVKFQDLDSARSDNEDERHSRLDLESHRSK